MIEKVILFDLDDTLIDTKVRHYKIYSDFLRSQGFIAIPFDDYLNLRNKGLKNKEIIASHSLNFVEKFTTFWNSFIEDEKYLMEDGIIVDIALLERLKTLTDSRFTILSLRSNESSARQQFASFSFASLFENVIFLKHSTSSNPKTRAIQHIKNEFEIRFFVGDAESDQAAAVANDVSFYGLKTGWTGLNTPYTFEDVNAFIKNKIHEFRNG